jgi:hypothetical protein
MPADASQTRRRRFRTSFVATAVAVSMGVTSVSATTEAAPTHPSVLMQDIVDELAVELGPWV